MAYERMRAAMMRALRANHARTTASIFLVALVLQGAYAWHVGMNLSSDTPGYLATCTGWVDDPISTFLSPRGNFYASFSLALCAWLAIPGLTLGTWVVAQVLLSAVGCGILHRIALRFCTPLAAALAGFFLAGFHEVFRWETWILSDTLFTFLLLLGALLTVRWQEDPSRRRRIGALSALATLAFCRPMGLPVALLWAGLVGQGGHAGSSKRLLPRWLVAAFWLVGVSVLVATSVVRHLPHKGTEAMWRMVVWDLPAFDNPLPFSGPSSGLGFYIANAPQIAFTVLLRAGAFFFPFSPTFSARHVILNLLTLVPVLVAGFVGLKRMLVTEQARMRKILLPPILVTLCIVSLSYVDYDWRYRSSVLPFMLVLAAWAVEPILARLPGVTRRRPQPALTPDEAAADQEEASKSQGRSRAKA